MQDSFRAVVMALFFTFFVIMAVVIIAMAIGGGEGSSVGMPTAMVMFLLSPIVFFGNYKLALRYIKKNK